MRIIDITDPKNGLFKKITEQSKTLKGSYHLSHNQGASLNTTNLEQYVEDVINGINGATKRYPVCVCTVPFKVEDKGLDGHYDTYKLDMFFLTQTHEQIGQIKDVNKFTNTSKHNVYHDLQDMDSVAQQFLKVLKDVILANSIMIQIGNRVVTQYLSLFQNDKLSGVHITFNIDTPNENCILDDYEANYLDTILPSIQSIHPLHQ